jgi:glycosyltransferase involved in cell wall biosynthesis
MYLSGVLDVRNTIRCSTTISRYVAGLSLKRASPKLISVVMPARNAEATISAQLDALAEQDYAGRWELVVADCGSTDVTREIARASDNRFPAFRLAHAYAAPRNGAAAARNRGATLAVGDLLVFCDADDVVARNWLSAIAARARDGDLLAGTLDTEMLNQPALRIWRTKAPWQRNAIHGYLPCASSANCAVWADVFAALGGFDEDHPGAEDRDLSYRAQLAGYRLLQAPDAVVAYRYRSGVTETMRQHFRWGLADARLYRDFARDGMPRGRFLDALRAWAWSIVAIPIMPWSHRRRGRWAICTAQLAGHLVGSFRERVLFI